MNRLSQSAFKYELKALLFVFLKLRGKKLL